MRPAPPAQVRAPWRGDCARAGQVAAILFSGFGSRTRSPSTSNDRKKRRANREGGRLFRCRHFAHPAAPPTRAQHIAIAQAIRLTCSLSSVSGEGGEPAQLCTPAGLLLEVDVCERSIGTLGGQSGVPVPR